jgi:translation initiation factor 1 (eIF-1/SUI1)
MGEGFTRNNHGVRVTVKNRREGRGVFTVQGAGVRLTE